jgi:type 1 glutamine amidotransferase
MPVLRGLLLSKRPATPCTALGKSVGNYWPVLTKRRLAAGLVCCITALLAPAAENRVLVYTRNHVTEGRGYVHENIPYSVEAIKQLGAENGFEVDSSDDPKLFTVNNLKRYRAIVFSNSNNEAFEDDQQREAFKSYVKSGGGIVGIHIATGSERKWPYFWQVMGGKFLRHPKLQKFTVRVKDRNHAATRHLPAEFEWEDECYYLDHLNPAMKVLLVTDPAKIDDPQKADYPGDRFGDSLPLSWYQTFEGGRQYYTALGHKKEHYTDPLMLQQILGGILWAIGKN